MFLLNNDNNVGVETYFIMAIAPAVYRWSALYYTPVYDIMWLLFVFKAKVIVSFIIMRIFVDIFRRYSDAYINILYIITIHAFMNTVTYIIWYCRGYIMCVCRTIAAAQCTPPMYVLYIMPFINVYKQPKCSLWLGPYSATRMKSPGGRSAGWTEGRFYYHYYYSPSFVMMRLKYYVNIPIVYTL